MSDPVNNQLQHLHNSNSSSNTKSTIDSVYDPSETQMSPHIYTFIRENWLTQKPNQNALINSAVSSLILTMGSLLYWSNYKDFAQWMSLTYSQILNKHEYWRLWTTLFVHADQKHLLGNLFLYFIFGYFISGYFGIFIFPFLSFFMGGIINWIIIKNLPPEVILMGASGVIFWMGGFWLTLYFLIETRKTIIKRLLRVLGVGLVLFMPSEAFDPHISYQSHLTGFTLGLIVGFIYYITNRKLFLNAEMSETIIDI